MWSFLYLAGYVGRIERRPSESDFDGLVRANRAREDDFRRGFSHARTTSGGGGRPAHLRVIRYKGETEQH